MSLPSASAALPETEPTACFAVHASAEPGVMPRVLELFAKRGLVPTSWTSRVSGRELTIDIQMRGLEGAVFEYMAQCLRQIAYVDVVLTTEKRGLDR
jgi:acetolactate synthase small subunit